MSTHGEQVADALGTLLRRDVRQRLYAHLTHEVAEGVHEATYLVLSGLDRCGPSTAAELAQAVGLDRSVVSRHATTLEKAGLLVRSTDPRDARWTRLALSPAGQEAVGVMRARLAALLDDFLRDWPAEAAARFATVLTALTKTGPFAG